MHICIRWLLGLKSFRWKVDVSGGLSVVGSSGRKRACRMGFSFPLGIPKGWNRENLQVFKKRRKEQPVNNPVAAPAAPLPDLVPPVPNAVASPAASGGGRGLRITIGAKLISLIAVLLIGSVSAIVVFSTQLFTEDSTSMIQQMNADKAGSLAIQLREQLEGTTEKMRVMGTILLPESIQTAAARDPLLAEYYVKDKEFVGVYVFQRQVSVLPGSAGPMKAISFSLSPEERAQDADGGKTLAALMGNPDFNPDLVAQGEIQISTLTLSDGSAGVAVSVPFISVPGSRPEENRFSHTVTAVIRQAKFMKAFGESDIITTYLVDRKGKLLAHPEASRVAAAESAADVGVVKLFLEGKANNQQTRYLDPRTQVPMLGAFRVVGFGGLGVVAEVAEAKAFEAAEKVERTSIYLALFVLSLAFFLGYVFSETIARPIRGLVEVARRISAGDFDIALKPRGKDEVANLSLAFNDMAMGLAERDRVKATFNKFHNKEIAEKLLSGEVKLGGERKEATIFFSDVRGFTAMSESMDPEQVVEMLNEYMTCMVSIIRKHNGVVDKYVGDAIMALWGVPVPHPEDTLNAVRACIEMRRKLAELNQLRLSRGQNELRIGMGLNHGVVIAGNIGSDEKMEYTVIGDAVNTASRMESMTKEYGTDLLVPKAVMERVADRFVFERAKDAKVKGKTETLQVFCVKGYVDEQGKAVIVETPYSSYASEKSDKSAADSHGLGPQEPTVSMKVVSPAPEHIAPAVASVIPIQKPRAVGQERTQTLTLEVPVARVANGGTVSATPPTPVPLSPPIVMAPPPPSSSPSLPPSLPPQVRPAVRLVVEKSNPFLTIQTKPDTVAAPPQVEPVEAAELASLPPVIQVVDHPIVGERTPNTELRILEPAEKTVTGFAPVSVTPEISTEQPPPLPITQIPPIVPTSAIPPLPPEPTPVKLPPPLGEPAPASALSPEFATLLMATSPRNEEEHASVLSSEISAETGMDSGPLVMEAQIPGAPVGDASSAPAQISIVPPAILPPARMSPPPTVEKVEEKAAESVELMPLEIMERKD